MESMNPIEETNRISKTLSKEDALFYCQEMFRNASGYYEFAEVAMKNLPALTEYSVGGVTPAGVNYSFACEIYLKSLILYDCRGFDVIKGKKKSHELKKLYERLPKEWQDSIKKYMESRRLWKDGFGLENLEKNSNAFIEWRYYYEKFWRKHASLQFETTFLRVFAWFLKESCASLFFTQQQTVLPTMN